MGLFSKIKNNLGSVQPPMISIQGNAFTLRDSLGNERPSTRTLDVIFVDGNPNTSKRYRENRDYNPNDPTPPDCFSDNGVAPSAQALKPQSETCIACPHNARGSRISKISGSAVKACDDLQKLAVVTADDPEGMLYQLIISPGSLQNFRAYVRNADSHNYEGNQIITRLSFVDKQIGVLAFEAVEAVPDEVVTFLTTIEDTPQAKYVTGADDQPRQGALPKPDAHQAIGLAQAEAPLHGDNVRQISTGAERREPAQPTREQLEATLAAQRSAREPAKRGRPKAVAEPVQDMQAVGSEIPAFLEKERARHEVERARPTAQQFGLVTNAPSPPAEVDKLLGERLTNAFALPTRRA